MAHCVPGGRARARGFRFDLAAPSCALAMSRDKGRTVLWIRAKRWREFSRLTSIGKKSGLSGKGCGNWLSLLEEVMQHCCFRQSLSAASGNCRATSLSCKMTALPRNVLSLFVAPCDIFSFSPAYVWRVCQSEGFRPGHPVRRQSRWEKMQLFWWTIQVAPAGSS
jgi:hypothetical protein